MIIHTSGLKGEIYLCKYTLKKERHTMNSIQLKFLYLPKVQNNFQMEHRNNLNTLLTSGSGIALRTLPQ